MTAIPHTTADPVQNIYGGDVMIPATTPETQLASWVFVKWFTSPEIAGGMGQDQQLLPDAGERGWISDRLSGENPQWATAMGLLPYGDLRAAVDLVPVGARCGAGGLQRDHAGRRRSGRSWMHLTDEANDLQEELMGEMN